MEIEEERDWNTYVGRGDREGHRKGKQTKGWEGRERENRERKEIIHMK